MTEAEREILSERMRSLGRGASRCELIARDARKELSSTLLVLLLLVTLVAVVARWITGQEKNSPAYTCTKIVVMGCHLKIGPCEEHSSEST